MTPDSSAPHTTPPAQLTVREVSKILRVSHMTVYRLIHSGDLGAFQIGRSFRVPATEVNSFLDRCRTRELGT